MTKPFDLKDLVMRLKGKGMDLAEESAKLVVVETMAWVKDSVVLSENKYDDFAIAILPHVEALVLKEVDKIDGQQG